MSTDNNVRVDEESSVNPSPNITLSTESCDSNRRGAYKKRSPAWSHFVEEYVNEIKHARCRYCSKLIPADPRNHGTTPLNTHVKKCSHNPNNNNANQATLCLGDIARDGGEVKGALMSWKFDQEAFRKSISYMLIVDELPFKHVEGKGFQHVMRTACPSFRMPSRWTISKDCYELYCDEKLKLKNLIKNTSNRVCLTTDCWTSIQRINYMCLTVHFIDNDWKLNKKILNFCPISSHKGNDLGKAIEKCLLEWGIDDVLTITVDNASSNDVAIQYLKGKFENWGKTVLGGKWTHVRCVAHIVNLIVQDGLKKVGDSIDCIKAVVRYVRQSPARMKKFKECAEIEKVDCKKSLILDVSTRWNSTYLMLDTAQRYERAFDRFEEQDPFMIQELGFLPTKSDWDRARHLVLFLENFYELTLKVSCTKYVTSNNFFHDISHISGILNELLESPNAELSSMAYSMKEKFDKYWGKIEKMNMLIFISSMLDPRNKFEYIEFVLMKMYGEVDGAHVAMLAKEAMIELFNEYKKLNYQLDHTSTCASSTSMYSDSEKGKMSFDGDAGRKIHDKYKLEFKKRKMELGGRDNKSELDKYLNEDCEDDDEKFDILLWWKANSLRFPILSKMARNVLAVPISTVASESAFSTGGRALDSFRSSLTPKVVQSLICTQDWLRSTSSTATINVEENLEDLEAFESGLVKSGAETTIIDI